MLKTIYGLQGVNILSKEAQRKVFGGNAPATGSACGVLFQSPNGGPRYVVYVGDENNSGGTKDDAISWAGNGQGIASLGNSYENTGHWCCDSCSNFQTMPSAAQ